MPVVNADKGAAKVELVPPNPYGYVFVAAEVDPEAVTTDVDRVAAEPVAGGIESRSARRIELHEVLRERLAELSKIDGVRSTAVFEAILFGPGTLARYPARGKGGRPARYDTLIMIETGTPQQAEVVLSDPDLTAVVDAVTERSSYVTVFPLTNVKKIDDVDRAKDGVFLFNFFFADDPERLLDIWDHTAGWWLDKGAMINSELLRPIGESEYAIINNARWDDARPAADAFRHPSYWDFVMVNIDASGATAMPSLYRLVR